jgi:signal transduction histidine kinase
VRVRITLAAVVVTGLAVASAGLLLVRSVENSQIRQLRTDVNADLDEIAARLQDGDAPEDAIEAATTFGIVRVIDERGRVLTADLAGAGGSLAIRSEVHTDTAPTGKAAEGIATVPDDPPTLDDLSPLPHPPVPGSGSERDDGAAPGPTASVGAYSSGGEGFTTRIETITRAVETRDGTLFVTADAPVDQMARSVDALRRALVVGLPALIAAVAALVWFLVGRALRPVEAIRAEADAITGSTMHRRVPEPQNRDEIGRLARTMNAMLSRLDDAATRQRQFVSDASHELRSPVAAIRTGLEVARRRPDRADWPAVADTALAEEARLEALLDDLLLLASQDENGDLDTPPTAPVGLVALARAETARPRRVPVQLGEPPAAAGALDVPGDAHQLARALANLVDNAARYATTAVTIGLVARDDTVRVTVDDDGPGVAPADRERIFERFTRLDDSRARGRGGTGLGLAVVRSIVTRHHGLVWVEDSPAGGVRVVVELHARQADPAAIRRAGPGRGRQPFEPSAADEPAIAPEQAIARANPT